MYTLSYDKVYCVKRPTSKHIKTKDTSLKDEESLEINVPEYVNCKKTSLVDVDINGRLCRDEI